MCTLQISVVMTTVASVLCIQQLFVLGNPVNGFSTYSTLNKCVCPLIIEFKTLSMYFVHVHLWVPSLEISVCECVCMLSIVQSHAKTISLSLCIHNNNDDLLTCISSDVLCHPY